MSQSAPVCVYNVVPLAITKLLFAELLDAGVAVDTVPADGTVALVSATAGAAAVLLEVAVAGVAPAGLSGVPAVVLAGVAAGAWVGELAC